MGSHFHNWTDYNGVNTRRLVLKKLFFCVGEYAEHGFDQQG